MLRQVYSSKINNTEDILPHLRATKRGDAMAELWRELGAVVVQFAATSSSHRLLERFMLSDLTAKHAAGGAGGGGDEGWLAVRLAFVSCQSLVFCWG